MKTLMPVAGLLLAGCPLVSGDVHDARIDVDGDGLVAAEYPGGTDCDDRDPGIGEGMPWYLDEDDDGFGVESDAVTACAAPSGRVSVAGDCDDTTAEVRPGAVELCNGLDDNCDGVRDDGLDVEPAYRDADDDGVGDEAQVVQVCAVPAGFTDRAGDCDDASAAVSPDADEVCNGVDDDCNDLVDDGLALSEFYADSDGDGFGDAGAPMQRCGAGDGFVADATDCDDASATAFPDASELCNGMDDDCDGVRDDGLDSLTPYFRDVDGDGFGDPGTSELLCAQPEGWTTESGDCDDSSDAVSPDSVEDCSLPGDEDCDPQTACGPRGDMMLLGVTRFAPEVLEWETGAALATVRDGPTTLVGIGARDFGLTPNALDGAVYVAEVPDVPGRVALADVARIVSDRTSFGWALSTSPDMDDDGTRDFVVGAPLTDFAGGRAFVVSSRDDDVIIPQDDPALLEVQSAGDWEHVGAAVASGADLTGDGVEDVVIGAPLSGDGGNAERGRVAIFSSTARGVTTVDAATTTLRGERGDRMGASVAVLRDFDGDGNADLAVSAPRDDASGLDSGAVAVFLGPLPSGRTDWDEADAYYFGISAGDGAGASIADAGDVNGDGLSDLLIGAPGRTQGGVTSRGAVYIVHGRANPATYTLASADMTFLGDGPLRFMGDVVAAAGDVDGDGLDDVLMGQPRAIESRGRAILQMAPFTDSPRVAQDGFIQSSHPEHVIGFSLAPAGDVNADGYDDILIGALGADPRFFDDGSAILVYGQP